MPKPKLSRTRIKNFRGKVENILDQELQLRADVKRLYSEFILDADDDPIAIRHVRQAFFHIQKIRGHKLLEERFEFHPFFGSNPFDESEFEDGDHSEEDHQDDDLL